MAITSVMNARSLLDIITSFMVLESFGRYSRMNFYFNLYFIKANETLAAKKYCKQKSNVCFLFCLAALFEVMRCQCFGFEFGRIVAQSTVGD